MQTDAQASAKKRIKMAQQQPLASALWQIGRRFRVELSFPSNTVGQLQSRRIDGDMTVAIALHLTCSSAPACRNGCSAERVRCRVTVATQSDSRRAAEGMPREAWA